MGREIKRVPLDFDWPLDKRWEGYVNPYWKEHRLCPACDGSGYNPEMKVLSDDWYDNGGFGVRWMYLYGVSPDGGWANRPPWKVVGDCRRWHDKLTQDEVKALFAAGRLSDLTYPLWYRRDDNGQWLVLDRQHQHKLGDWQPCNPPEIPTPEQVNEWAEHGIGHDAINASICLRVRATRLGVYGLCPICNGDGDWWPSSGAKEKYDTWQKTEPPAGDGWQVWETVSEGSPISPVFETAGALADWLVKEGYSRKAAEKFIHEDGWCPSAVMVDGQFYSDIESCAV